MASLYLAHATVLLNFRNQFWDLEKNNITILYNSHACTSCWNYGVAQHTIWGFLS